jgi:hypothetical protein
LKDRGFLYVCYYYNSVVAWSEVLAQGVSRRQEFGGGLQVGQEDEDQDPLVGCFSLGCFRREMGILLGLGDKQSWNRSYGFCKYKSKMIHMYV